MTRAASTPSFATALYGRGLAVHEADFRPSSALPRKPHDQRLAMLPCKRRRTDDTGTNEIRSGATGATGPQAGDGTGARPETPTRSNTTDKWRKMFEPLEKGFDEQGAELAPGARVWEAYIAEANRHDARIVGEWDNTTNAILVFAALFSAIYTAFLIESTKMLKADPADVSSQTLIEISRTLLTMANGTQVPGSLAPPGTNTTDFTPSHTAVCVNILWYLALSLSLATSLVATLSKSWNHSFLSGREGELYLQASLRQRKWDMLNRCKVAELLGILPSMIHTSVFLFSIGLCIYLWDVHAVVSIPVILVVVVATIFYIFSSVAGTILDTFPFPTVISRLCRAELVQRLSRHPLLKFLEVLTFFGCLLLWTIEFLVVQLARAFNPVFKVNTPLGGHPTNQDKSYCERILDHLSTTGEWIKDQYRKSMEALLQESGLSGSCNTTRALAWLIQNGKTAGHIDIALQSIAGADGTFDYDTLSNCGATALILKRLTTDSSSCEDRAYIINSLYCRALSFLAGDSHAKEPSNKHALKDDWKQTIPKIQAAVGEGVASYIRSEIFDASAHNLFALHVGNTMASRILQSLQAGDNDKCPLLDSTTELLQQHLNGNKHDLLHPSALVSLVGTASVLSLFTDDHPATSELPNLCIKAAQNLANIHGDRTIIKMTLIACVLLQNNRTKSLPPKPRERFVTTALESLVRLQLNSGQDLEWMIQFALEYLGHSPETYHLGSSRSEIAIVYEDHRCRDPMDEISAGNVSSAALKYSDPKPGALEALEALHVISNLTSFGTPCASSYTFVLQIIFCRDASNLPKCWQLMSKFCFPKGSPELVLCLQKSPICESLEQRTRIGNNVMEFFAISQLWIFLVICSDPSTDNDVRNQLQAELSRYVPEAHNFKDSESGRKYLGGILEREWNNSSDEISRSLGAYADRLMECVLQSQGRDIPQQLQDRLCDIPEDIRGLSSFTNWRPSSLETQTWAGKQEAPTETEPRRPVSSADAANDYANVPRAHPSSGQPAAAGTEIGTQSREIQSADENARQDTRSAHRGRGTAETEAQGGDESNGVSGGKQKPGYDEPGSLGDPDARLDKGSPGGNGGRVERDEQGRTHDNGTANEDSNQPVGSDPHVLIDMPPLQVPRK